MFLLFSFIVISKSNQIYSDYDLYLDEKNVYIYLNIDNENLAIGTKEERETEILNIYNKKYTRDNIQMNII